MISKKIGAAAALVAASSLLLAGCARGEEAAGGDEIREQTLTFAYITAETFPYHNGAERFKEIVEEESEGAITVDLYPGGQLGQERDINESILEGSIQIGVGAGALAALAPIMNLLELPFLIQDQAHMNRIVDSEVSEQIAAKIADAGFYVLDWFSTGDSSIQTVDTPITEPSDLQGLKLRSIENPALADALQSLGANPTPMPYGEIYTGIQTNVIEGATLDWGSVDSMHLAELIGYATSPDAAFLAEPRPVIVSSEFWEGLNEAERELIGSAMEEAAAYEREYFAETLDQAVANVIEAGVTITELDSEAFLAALQPVWDKWAAELEAEEILQGILDLRE